MSDDELKHIEFDQELEFLDKLDLDELKYELSRELGDEYEGVGPDDDKPERIPPKMQVRVSDDAMEAYLTVLHPGKPRSISIDLITEFLKKKKVVNGLLEENMEKILDEQLVDQEVLVARGKEPERGKDARIEIKIEDSKDPEDCVDARGRVDFKQMRLKNVVEKGDLVAELIPATPGEPGYTVNGKELKPTPGAEKEFKSSPDLELSEDGRKLFAKKNGVLFKDWTIKDINIIESDVSYSTGNITYPKSLIIKGDVKSGFSVRSGGNIEIHRCVEDAVVKARGDVIVKEGFLGTGKGLIKGMNVTIGHVKQQRVEAEGDIGIGGEVLYGKLRSEGVIKIIGVKGFVIGGEIVATRGIEVVNAGNAQNIRTYLCAGYSREVVDIDTKIEKLRNYLKKVEDSIAIYRKAGPLERLSDTKKKLLMSLQRSHTHIEEEIAKELTGREEKLNELQDEYKPYIKVTGTVFRNTTIQIGDFKRYIEKEMRNKIFIVHNNKILDTAASTLSRADVKKKNSQSENESS